MAWDGDGILTYSTDLSLFNNTPTSKLIIIVWTLHFSFLAVIDAIPQTISIGQDEDHKVTNVKTLYQMRVISAMVIFKHESTIISTRNQSLFLVISLLFFISFQPIQCIWKNAMKSGLSA